MPDNIEFSADIGPIVDHVALVHSQSARADRLEQLRSQQTRCWAATEQYAEQLNRLYEEIARSGHEADWLAQAAEIVHQREGAEQERLRPGIEALKQRLATPQGVHDAEEIGRASCRERVLRLV